ncbi:MAG: ATP-dependent helicase, partial [Lachnospiraceae bacterium]|nr:ATP-dependent helicase [Lachnospiraceae bacterium]
MNSNQPNQNAAQTAAITHGDGPMLVLAGPGSGKTFVITQRIKYLIEELHVKPEDILVITFTKAAAKEMQERFFRIAKEGGSPVNFGTFHATFFNMLRYTYKFTAQNIIREGDKYKFIAKILEEMPTELASQDQASDQTHNQDDDVIQRLLSEISKVKNNGITPQELKSETMSQTEFEYIYDAYKKEMNSHRLIDFDDMVLLCRDLLVSRPEVLHMWQNRFKYILIDEFQDICPLQYEVVRLLAKPQDNLFIVGDDDQAIYGFRGSKPEIMLHFKDDYPNAKQVLLNVNYRSKRDIVETAGKLIVHNEVRFAKQVETKNPQTDGVKVYSFVSKHQQAKNIALLIQQYMQQEGAHYSDIAILYRTNSHFVYTAQRLMQEG